MCAVAVGEIDPVVSCQLKAAVRATHGVVIHSESALFSRATGSPLPAVERGYHLYENYAFVNDPTGDGAGDR